MQIDERTSGDIILVGVTGEITLNQGGDLMLKDKIRSLIQNGHRKLVVDMAKVSYVDSAGLGELVQAQSTVRNHGGVLKLSSPPQRLRELLVLTKLTTVLRVYDDETQALESFATQPV